MNSTHFWSRSRSNVSNFYRRCRCYTCLSHPHNAILLRRPGANKLAQWRKLTTLFYSSLFATAAAADVQAKQSRRQRWDDVIAAAEEEVEEGRKRQRQSDAATLMDAEAEPPTACTNAAYGKEVHDPRTALALALHKVNASTVPVPFGLLGRDPGRESIYASESMKMKESRWTPKKLMLIELAMAKLALRFSMTIPHVDQSGSVVNGRQLRLMPMLKEITHKLESAKSYDPLSPDPKARPGLPCYSPNRRVGSPPHRNQPLDAILLEISSDFKCGLCALPEYLAKLSQNLLACRYPPEASSMTIILNVLSQKKHFELASAVCECIWESKIRPDEICVDAIVNHYIAANDQAGFNYVTRKIDGYHGGLALAREDIRITPHSAQRLRKHNGKTLQLLVKDKILWHSILRGHLHFGQLQSSLRAFYDMTVAGSTVNASEMNSFLGLAVRKENFQLGMDLWRLVRPVNFGTSSHEHDVAIKQVFRLCEACGRLDERSKIQSWLSARGFTSSALMNSRYPTPLQVSQDVEALRRAVRIIARKTNLENIRFQRRARLVVGTQLRLAGFDKQQVKELFGAVGSLELNYDIQTPLERSYARYRERVKRARWLLKRHISRAQQLEHHAAISACKSVENISTPSVQGISAELTAKDLSEETMNLEDNARSQSRSSDAAVAPRAQKSRWEANKSGLAQFSSTLSGSQLHLQFQSPGDLRGLGFNHADRQCQLALIST